MEQLLSIKCRKEVGSMSEYNISENDLYKQFAYLIYSDVQKYVNENTEEYEKWLKEKELKDQRL